MSSDIVNIGLKVDSTDVKQGTNALDDFGKSAERNEKKTNKLEGAIKKTGVALTSMAAMAGAAAVAFSVVKTTAFNKSISELQAITGAAGEDLAYLRSQAKLLGSTTTQSASEVATAFKLVASAKPDLLSNAQALSQVTEQVILLAEASGNDLAASADTVGASLNQFGVEADQAARFVNVLAAGSKFGSSAVNETSEALKNAGTVAAGAGLSFEQTNAAIQALAKVAIKGGEAGTGLRGVLLKLSTQTNDDFNPKIVGFTQAIKNLEAAELSDVEMKKLFGQESITSANALIQEADTLDALTASLTGTTTATDQARIMVDNLDGDLTQLASATEGAAIALGSNLDPWLRNVAQASTEAMQGLEIFINVMAGADDQTALAVQIADTTERLKDLKDNGLVISGEWLSFSSSEAAVASLEAELKSLEERRNKILKHGGGSEVSTPKQASEIELIRAQEQAKADALAVIDENNKASAIAKEKQFLEQMLQTKQEALLASDELEAVKLQRELDMIEQSKQRLIDAGLSEVKATQEIENVKTSILAVSAKKQAEDAAKNETDKQRKIASLQASGWNTLTGIAALGGKKFQKMVLEADLIMATSKAISGSIAAWTSGMELGGLPVAIASEAAHWGHVVSIMGQLKGMGASGATATAPTSTAPTSTTSQPSQLQVMDIKLKIEGLTGNESPDVLQKITDMLTPAISDQLAAGGNNVAVI